MDPKELDNVSEALEEMRRTGTLSAETLAKLNESGNTARKTIDKLSESALKVGKNIGNLAKDVAEGSGSFSSLGSTIEATAKVMGNLLNTIPLVGGAAKALAEGVGAASKFVLDQLDTMAKNYQTLGDASAGAADGVDGLLRQFNQLGNYSLPAFAKAVKANTLGMAALQGTAGRGAEELSKVAGSLTKGDLGKQFLKLGIGLDQVGDATAEYLSTSARYGLTQGNTTEELTKKTQNYIEEVDKIARLTGQTREAQAKEAQKSLVDARFRAKLADMEAKGQGVQAEELRKYVEGLGGAAGDAARALATGIPLTKDAAKANLFSNDALRQNTIAIQNGKKATTAIADTQQALADGSVRFRTQLMYTGDTLGGVAIQGMDAASIIKQQNKLMETGLTREEAIAKLQEKQKKASGKTTEEFTDAQMAVAGSSKNLQSLGFTLAKAAIPAVDAFASGLQKVTGFIDEKFGSGVPGGAGGDQQGTSLWNKVKNVLGLGPGGGPNGTGPMAGPGPGGPGASLGPGGPTQATTTADLKKMGLNIKQGDVQKEGAGLSPQLVELAKKIQSGLPGFGTFTGFNDNFHNEKAPGSTHTKGLAMDFTLQKAPTEQEGRQIVAALKQMGANYVLDEYNHPSPGATAGHIHAQVSAENGAVLSGPKSGYKPNLTMHGTEAIVPLDKANTIKPNTEQASNQSSIDKHLAEMVALQRQNNLQNAKILQQAKAG